MSIQNDKFIWISPNIGTSLGIGLAAAIFYTIICHLDKIFLISTPKAGFFATEIAALSFEWQLIIVCLIAPVIEEGLFRGAFYGTVSTILDEYGIVDDLWTRIIITTLIISFLFSVFHAQAYGWGALQVAYFGAFFFSIIACVLTLYTESLIPAIILHITINSTIFFGLYVVY